MSQNCAITDAGGPCLVKDRLALPIVSAGIRSNGNSRPYRT